MSLLVRVNRDHNRQRWTVQAQDGRRLGHAIGLLLKDVTFVTQGPSGWADGELVSWCDLAVDPKFCERLEARTIERLELTFWPLDFEKGEFFLQGLRRCLGGIRSCSWLRILGAGAEIAEPRYYSTS